MTERRQSQGNIIVFKVKIFHIENIPWYKAASENRCKIEEKGNGITVCKISA